MLKRLTSSDQDPGWTIGLALWLAVQLLALTIAALRVPLSARYPDPAEQLAAELMLIVQMISAAALAPMLLSQWRGLAAAGLTLWPMLYLAAVLSGLPATAVAPAGAMVCLWLAALWLWAGALREPRWRMTVAAAGLMLTLGGGLLWYLDAEFAAGAGDRAWVVASSPMVAALLQLKEPRPHWPAWLLLALLAGGGLIARLLRRRAGAAEG